MGHSRPGNLRRCTRKPLSVLSVLRLPAPQMSVFSLRHYFCPLLPSALANLLLREYSKEAGNRLLDITDRLPVDAQTALSSRGWSLYIMNMVFSSGNQLIFRKGNEQEYQPYFGSTAKSQLRGSILPELSAESLEGLCRRLPTPQLMHRISALPDLTVCDIFNWVYCALKWFDGKYTTLTSRVGSTVFFTSHSCG